MFLSTSSLIFPYYQGDPTIFNKVLYPQLEFSDSFQIIIIVRPPFYVALHSSNAREVVELQEK
jgi:hypothetical protein